jgi:hypothetical protein
MREGHADRGSVHSDQVVCSGWIKLWRRGGRGGRGGGLRWDVEKVLRVCVYYEDAWKPCLEVSLFGQITAACDVCEGHKKAGMPSHRDKWT